MCASVRWLHHLLGRRQLRADSGANAGTGTDFVQVSAGYCTTCARRADSTIVCWCGRGQAEQMGAVTRPNMDGGSDFQQLSANEHTCALRAPGSIICWGQDEQGQVSMPNADASTNFVQIDTGYAHTCLRRA